MILSKRLTYEVTEIITDKPASLQLNFNTSNEASEETIRIITDQQRSERYGLRIKCRSYYIVEDVPKSVAFWQSLGFEII